MGRSEGKNHDAAAAPRLLGDAWEDGPVATAAMLQWSHKLREGLDGGCET